MLCAAIYTFVCIFIIILELIPIFQSKRIKEGIIYSIILAFGYVVTICYAFGLIFLNPNAILTKIVEYFIK